MRKTLTVMTCALVALVGCSDTQSSLDQRWDELSADQRGDTCDIYEVRGVEGVVDVIERGNPDVDRDEVREWIDNTVDSYCS